MINKNKPEEAAEDEEEKGMGWEVMWWKTSNIQGYTCSSELLVHKEVFCDWKGNTDTLSWQCPWIHPVVFLSLQGKKKPEHQCCFREEDFRGIVGEAWRILRPDTLPPHVRGSQSHSTYGETEVWRPTTIMLTATTSQIAKLWSFTVSALHTTLSENKLSGSPFQNTQRHLR